MSAECEDHNGGFDAELLVGTTGHSMTGSGAIGHE
jgi:hypothetical protein